METKRILGIKSYCPDYFLSFCHLPTSFPAPEPLISDIYQSTSFYVYYKCSSKQHSWWFMDLAKQETIMIMMKHSNRKRGKTSLAVKNGNTNQISIIS